MNEVSIIIGGVRYDLIPVEKEKDCLCCNCDLNRLCVADFSFVDLCTSVDDTHVLFKKSDKKFET